MSSVFACGHCGARLKLAKTPAKGAKVTCPKCGETTRLTPTDAVTAKPTPKGKTAASRIKTAEADSVSVKRPKSRVPMFLVMGGVALLLLALIGVGASVLAYNYWRPGPGKLEPIAVGPKADDILKKAQADQDALAKAELDKLAKEKADADKLAKEKTDADKLAKEKADADKLAQAKKQQDYLAAMKEADADARDKKYAEAIASYEKALALMPGNAEATQKLTDVRTAQEAATAEQRQKELARLKGQGDQALMNMKFAVAVEFYQAYLKLDKEDAGVIAALKEARAGLVNDLARKKLNAEFQAHIDAAEKAVEDGKLDLARKEIAAARAINPTSPAIVRLQRLVDLASAQAKSDPKTVKDPAPADPKKKDADPKTLLKQATAARNAKRWKEAERLYRQVLDIDNKDAQAALGLEAVLQAQKTALVDYDRLLTQGKQALLQNQSLNAINLLQQADKIYPENTEVQPLLRQALALLDQQRKTAYGEAMERGSILKSQGKYKESLQAYDEALEAFPQDMTARLARNAVRQLLDTDQKGRYSAAMGRGNLLKAQKKYQEALKAFDEALQFVPNDQAALTARNDVLRLINPDVAVGKDKKKKIDPAALTPEQQQRYFQAMNQGYNALKTNMPEAAIQFFQAALEIAPGDVAADKWLNFAKSQKKGGKK